MGEEPGTAEQGPLPTTQEMVARAQFSSRDPASTSLDTLQVFFKVKCHIHCNIHVFINHLRCVKLCFLSGSNLY